MKALHKLAAWFALFVCTVTCAQDSGRLELPAFDSGDIILEYSGFVVNYNENWLIPNWVAYELNSTEVDGEVPRAKGFGMDPDFKGRQAMREDYRNSGYDKGHMAPAADMKWSAKAMSESFYLTNICPQNHELNSRDWHALEKYVRMWAAEYGQVWVVCGPYVCANLYGTIGERSVVVPDGFFKAVLRKDGKGYKSIAFVFENTSERQPVTNAVVSVNDVEALTGFDLFANIPDRLEEQVESQEEWSEWSNKR